MDHGLDSRHARSPFDHFPIVNFIYLDPAGRESHDRQVIAYVPFKPEIGDKFTLKGDKREAVVRKMTYQLTDIDGYGTLENPAVAVLNVILGTADQVPIRDGPQQR